MGMDKRTHTEGEISIAAFLWCRGFKFAGCVPDDHRRGRLLFAFEDEEGGATQARIEFLNGGQCSAKDFAAALADLKSQLYEAKDGNGYGKGQQASRR
jgi:hypothetical protein